MNHSPAAGGITLGRPPPVIAGGAATIAGAIPDLGGPRRIWAVGAVQGALDPLRRLHRWLADRVETGDRLIYLGNLIGVGAHPVAVLEEILMFRRAMLSLPSVIANDVQVLRGADEALLTRLGQIPLAGSAPDLVQFMVAQGLGPALTALGLPPEALRAATARGAEAMARLVQQRLADGLPTAAIQLLGSLAPAAMLSPAPGRSGLLFVAAGYDPRLSLDRQGDTLWWGARSFRLVAGPVPPGLTLVRGHDPEGGRVSIQKGRITLDGGSGRGGVLCLGQFAGDGTLSDIIDFA